MSYAGNWYGSGQIPARAVDQGLITRFGSHRPRRRGEHRPAPAGAAVPAAPDDSERARACSPTPGPTGSTCSRTSRCSCAIPTTATRSSRSTGGRSTAASSATASCTSVGPVTLTRRIGADGAQRRHPRGAVEHAAPAAADGGARQRRAPDLDRRLRRRGDHAAAVAARSTSAAAPTCCRSPSTTRLLPPIRTAPVSGVGAAHQFSPKASLIVTPLDRRARAARPLRSTTGMAFTRTTCAACSRPAGDAAGACHRRGAGRARAAVRALGSGGRAVAARSRQRNRLDWRRGDDGGRRRRPRAGASSSRRATS